MTESTGPVVRLSVQNLQVNLTGQDVDVVSEVAFSVTKGEVLGLVGESGSGKTTVAHAILGYARRGLTIVGPPSCARSAARPWPTSRRIRDPP